MSEKGSWLSKSIKVAGVNAILIVFGLIIVDLIFGNWLSYITLMARSGDGAPIFSDRYYRTVFQFCPDSRLHHNLCPEISYRVIPDPKDGEEPVIHYVNRSSLLVSDASLMNSETDVSDFDVVNIGDSFMQAAAIPFDETLSQTFEKHSGLHTLQVGVASWAVMQYAAWLKRAPLKNGVQVNVFVMVNDLLPGSKKANLSYHRMAETDKRGEARFPSYGLPLPANLKHLFVMNSAVRRERRRFPVGAEPTRQLSLRPVAIGAVVEATKRLKPPV